VPKGQLTNSRCRPKKKVCQRPVLDKKNVEAAEAAAQKKKSWRLTNLPTKKFLLEVERVAIRKKLMAGRRANFFFFLNWLAGPAQLFFFSRQ
jgi:hypothetical protein